MNLQPFLCSELYATVRERSEPSSVPSVPVLAEALRQTGLGGFGDGLLWIDEPEVLEATVRPWLSPRPGVSMVPFARTAFGNVFYVAFAEGLDPSPGLLDVHFKSMRPAYALDLEDFFTRIILDETYRREELQLSDFERARADHGPLSKTECYYPVPALALGGSFGGALEKGRWDVHLELLRQL